MIVRPDDDVTLGEVYRKIVESDGKHDATNRKVDKLAESVSELVAVNHRLDEHKAQLRDHNVRITDNSFDITELKAKIRPRAPWYNIVGAIAAILASVTTLFGLAAILVKIGEVL